MKAGKVIERGTNAIYIPFKDSEAAKKAGDTKEPPTWLAFGYGDEYPEEAVVQWWTKDWRDIIINGNGKYAHKVTGDKTSSIDRILDITRYNLLGIILANQRSNIEIVINGNKMAIGQIHHVAIKTETPCALLYGYSFVILPIYP